MRAVHPMLMIGAALALSACAGGQSVTRGNEAAPVGFSVVETATPGAQVLAPRYNVQEVRVEVPPGLRVSEANRFYPIADIVWRGEPAGDRYEQVRAIFLDAFGFGTSGMTVGQGVIVEATVQRFHALTEKTRYTVGGVHAIHFDLTVRDAATGAVLKGPRLVRVDVPAWGGRRALEEERAGRTQRVVIVEGLAQAIRRELSVPVAAPQNVTVVAPPAPGTPVSQGTVSPARDPLTGVAILQTGQMSL
jgi:hypothetical protein